MPQKQNKTILAYETIRKKILSNTYPLGTALSERDLSEQLSISRTPVKDALKRLHFEGYVDILPERGAVVSKIGLSDTLELYEIREALEGHFVRLAAERRRSEDLEQMTYHLKMHRQMFAEGTYDNTEYEDAFHIDLAKASFNQRLVSYLDCIIRQCGRTTVLHNRHSAQRIERSIAQHQEILDAVRDGDPDRAEQAMRAHLQDVIESTKVLLRDFYFLYK